MRVDFDRMDFDSIPTKIHKKLNKKYLSPKTLIKNK